jgi:hypothetical protein
MLTPNEVRTRGGLYNIASMTPSAHVLHFSDPESFLLARSPKSLSGDLRRLQLHAKHDEASFALCVGVTNSRSQLVGVA